MFKEWKRKKAIKKALQTKIRADAYLTRLQNSTRGFCGCSHEGSGPFLTIGEIDHLLWEELKRRTQ